ncbi:TonB-dependent receptor plug domain-containing protein [Candidatus Omnitrophota bacterium]
MTCIKRAVIFIILMCSFAGASFPEEAQYQLEKITVTGSRMPASSIRQARNVAVITSEDLGALCYSSIQDAIGGIGAIDLRRRGQEGIQADVSIRGSTFEQSQILIDGIKVNNPQTGHHNLDIPLTRFDIERIDILKGHGSSVYGPNAFGGVINFRTERPEGARVIVDSSGGSYDYYQGGFSCDYPVMMIKNRSSFDTSRSTGYRAETEFKSITAAHAASLESPFGLYDLLFGYSKKDFGADSFYSDRFINEEEHTENRFMKLSGEIDAGDIKAAPVVFLKRHRDKFALDRNRPGWATNYHTTYHYGAETAFAYSTEFADAAYGLELSRETIDSTNLGLHKRTKTALYAEVSPHIHDDIRLSAGFREDWNSDFGWAYSPSINASYNFMRHFRIRSSAGRSFRAPTFTDLYYRDAASIGNEGLGPEHSWNYEAGFDVLLDEARFKSTVFRRETKSSIDWTRQTPAERWMARNIGEVDTNGLEISLAVDLKKTGGAVALKKLSVDYTLLDAYFKHDYFSRYISDYLKQHISSRAELELPYSVKSSWVVNFKKRKGDSGFMVVDTKLSKTILKKDAVKLEAFVEATNLFDIEYSEQSNVPLPGRWIKSGARLEF